MVLEKDENSTQNHQNPFKKVTQQTTLIRRIESSNIPPIKCRLSTEEGISSLPQTFQNTSSLARKEKALNLEASKHSTSSNFIKNPPSPKKRSFSILSCCYCVINMYKGLFFTKYDYLFNFTASHEINKEEMLPLNESISAKHSLYKIREIKKMAKKKGIIMRDIQYLIYSMIKPLIVKAILLKAVENILILSLTILPKIFIPEIKKKDSEKNYWLIALCTGLAFLMTYSQLLLAEHSAQYVNRCSSETNQALRVLLFKKFQESNISFVDKVDQSLVTKLLTFNLPLISLFIGNLPDLFSFPLILLFSVVLIAVSLGYLALILFLVYPLVWLIILYLIKKMIKHEVVVHYYSSKRSLLVMEVLAKLKKVKTDRFEELFSKRIEEVRKQELIYFQKKAKLKVLTDFFVSFSGVLVVLSIQILNQQLLKTKLGITAIFSLISIVASLQKPMKNFVQMVYNYYGYLYAKESFNNFIFKVPDRTFELEEDSSLPIGSFQIKKCIASISSHEEVDKLIHSIFQTEGFDLANKSETQRVSSLLGTIKLGQKQLTSSRLNIDIKSKEKVCLLSSDSLALRILFYTMLGETRLVKGRAFYRGKVIYSDSLKAPFLVGQTLRENIIMGETMIPSLYNKIISVIGFNLHKFKGGDKIQVLAKAQNFSKSERRKILIARMLYISGDIYIMRNFFGYDELETELIFFRRVVQGFLIDKTVIFDCNLEKILESSDKIITISRQNTRMYSKQEYLKSRPYLRKFKIKRGLSKVYSFNGKKVWQTKTKAAFNRGINKVILRNRIVSSRRLIQTDAQVKLRGLDTATEIVSYLYKGMKINVEKTEKGRIVKQFEEGDLYLNLQSYIFSYLFLLGKFRFFVCAAIFTLSAGLYIFSDVWVGIWSSDSLSSFDTYKYTLVYMVVSILAPVIALLRDLYFYTVIYENSQKVHDLATKTLFGLRIDWLSQYPTTDIDYKLTFEMRRLDLEVNPGLHAILDTLVFTLFGLLLLNYIYFGFMLVITLVFFVLTFRYLRIFTRTTKYFIKFLAENESKLSRLFNTTVVDIASFRHLKKTNLLKEQFQTTTDELQRATTHYFFFSKRWLGVRLGFLIALLVSWGYVAPLLVNFIAPDLYQLSTFKLALAFTWSLKIVSYIRTLINWCIKLYEDIVSFAKLSNFSNKAVTEQEGDVKLSRGLLRTQNPFQMTEVDVTQSKRKLLNKIDLKIEKDKLTGIVGDSGSGKHVLVDLMLKINSLDKSSTSLDIFGIDYHQIDPKELRDNVIYLEENPTLFSGTFRENIDPNNNFEDHEIIWCLNKLRILEVWNIKRKNRTIKKRKPVKPTTINPKEMSRIMDGIDIGHVQETTTKLLTNQDTRSGHKQDEVLSLKDENMIKQLMELKFESDSSYVPLNVKRLIKLSRAILLRPYLLIYEQNALKILHSQEFMSSRYILSNLFPDSTFLVILSTFRELLDVDHIYMLNQGKISLSGSSYELIKDKSASLISFLKKKDIYMHYYLESKVNSRTIERQNDGFRISNEHYANDYFGDELDERPNIDFDKIDTSINRSNILTSKNGGLPSPLTRRQFYQQNV